MRRAVLLPLLLVSACNRSSESAVGTTGAAGPAAATGAAAPTGPTGVDSARAASSAPAPPWSPTTAYQARREPLPGSRSVLAIAPDDVWVLGNPEPYLNWHYLYHYDGHAWSDRMMPSTREESVSFYAQSLAQGPAGILLVIGVREDGRTRRPCVLERVDGRFRERRTLSAALSAIPDPGSLTYAVSRRGREVLCNSEPPLCIEAGEGVGPRRLPDDQGRRMPGIPDLFRRKRGEASMVTLPVLFAGETLWRVSGWAREDDVWGLDSASVVRSHGSDLERIEAPLQQLQSVWASGRDDLWLTGQLGDREAVARFDGARWWRIAGIDLDPDAGMRLAVTGSSREDVWVYGSSGVWHVTPHPRAQPNVEGTPAPPPPAAVPSRALAISGVDGSYRLERVVLEVEGDRPLRTALSVAEGPGGVVWLHEGARVVEHDGARSRVVYAAPRPKPFACWPTSPPASAEDPTCTRRHPPPLTCQRCVAPLAVGEGAALTEQGWQRIHGGHAMPDERVPLLAPLAVAALPSGAIWGVSASPNDIAHAALDTPAGWRLVAGAPAGAYADVAARADDDVWMAGGLSTITVGGSLQPAGEGTLVRFDGHAFTRHRAPDGVLLSVAAPAPGEAWAVGLAGTALHVKAGAVEAFHLTGEDGGRLPVALRGVAAAGPNEVWIVGDGSTLLRWDGTSLRRVDASAAGRDAALSGVIAPGVRAGWVVGPGGIWRVVRM